MQGYYCLYFDILFPYTAHVVTDKHINYFTNAQIKRQRFHVRAIMVKTVEWGEASLIVDEALINPYHSSQLIFLLFAASLG